MNFTPLTEALFPIPLHAWAALAALVIGGYQLYARKGTKRHAIVGYFWVGLMLITAISSLWISEIKMIGRFSPIHILVPVTLISLWVAISGIRQGNVKRHARAMKILYVSALLVAGLFTLLPGRIMHQVLFGG